MLMDATKTNYAIPSFEEQDLSHNYNCIIYKIIMKAIITCYRYKQRITYNVREVWRRTNEPVN